MNTDNIEWEKLYTHSKEYAAEHGELEQYEESIDYTARAAIAISVGIDNHYSDEKLHHLYLTEERFSYLDSNFRAELLDCEKVLEYVRAYAEDEDRIALVLARTILSDVKSWMQSLLGKPYRSYFSEEVVEWASTIDTLDFIKDEEIGIPVFYHPAAINAFAEYYIENH